LQKSWNKYGEHNFIFETIMVVFDIKYVRQIEKLMIKSYNSYCDGYNNTESATGVELGYHHSEETKKKMSKSHVGKQTWCKGVPRSEETKMKISKTTKGKKRPKFSEEWRKNIGKASKGRVISEETRRKISESLKGRKKKPFSEEHKKKLAESSKNDIINRKRDTKTGRFIKKETNI
jgi:group I intron endonuclease